MRIKIDLSIPNALWYLITLLWQPTKLVLGVYLVVQALRFSGVKI